MTEKHNRFHIPSYFKLVDIITFAYLSFAVTVLLAFNTAIAGWHYYLLGHLVFFAVLIGFFKLTEGVTSRFVMFWRHIYPLAMFSFTFKEISVLLNALTSFWFEHHLLAWDNWLIEGYPTVVVQQYYRPWLTEFMAFSYWSYYLVMPLAALIFVVRKKWDLLQSLGFHLAFTMYMCYLAYYALPARGPQQTLAHLHLPREAAGFFDSMVLNIQATASISGCAFPSSHVAAIWIAVIFLFKYRTWLGWAVVPLVIALTVSTVYLQYHYIPDAVAGTLFVFITYPLGRKLELWYEGKQTNI